MVTLGSNVKNNLFVFNLFLRSLILPINIAALSCHRVCATLCRYNCPAVVYCSGSAVTKGYSPLWGAPCLDSICTIFLSKIWTENL